MSLIDVTFKPADCTARIADSRPAPGPWTLTSTSCIPWLTACRAASCATIVAAYAVLFREPLKPHRPAEFQETTLPRMSVMVTIVLLKEA